MPGPANAIQEDDSLKPRYRGKLAVILEEAPESEQIL
jgi:hypothetical protein